MHYWWGWVWGPRLCLFGCDAKTVQLHENQQTVLRALTSSLQHPTLGTHNKISAEVPEYSVLVLAEVVVQLLLIGAPWSGSTDDFSYGEAYRPPATCIQRPPSLQSPLVVILTATVTFCGPEVVTVHRLHCVSWQIRVYISWLGRGGGANADVQILGGKKKETTKCYTRNHLCWEMSPQFWQPFQKSKCGGRAGQIQAPLASLSLPEIMREALSGCEYMVDVTPYTHSGIAMYTVE